jgi:uncharacterized protein (DUF1778 family)
MSEPSGDESDQSNTTAKAIETVNVSHRDFKRVLVLLEHPPKPNAKLQAAIAALPDTI